MISGFIQKYVENSFILAAFSSLSTFSSLSLAEDTPVTRLEVNRRVAEFDPLKIYDVREDTCQTTRNGNVVEYSRCVFPKLWSIRQPNITQTTNPRIQGLPFILKISYRFVCYSSIEMHADLSMGEKQRIQLFPRSDARITDLPDIATSYSEDIFSIKLDTEPQHVISNGCYLGINRFEKIIAVNALKSYSKELLVRYRSYLRLQKYLDFVDDQFDLTVDLLTAVIEQMESLLNERISDLEAMGIDTEGNPEITLLHNRIQNMQKNLSALQSEESDSEIRQSVAAQISKSIKEDLKLISAERESILDFMRGEFDRKTPFEKSEIIILGDVFEHLKTIANNSNKGG